MRRALPGPEMSDYAALIRPTDCYGLPVHRCPSSHRSVKWPWLRGSRSGNDPKDRVTTAALDGRRAPAGVRAIQKVLLVHRLQHHQHRALKHVRSGSARSGAAAASSARDESPVATAIAFAAMHRAHRTSSGVSPITVVSSGSAESRCVVRRNASAAPSASAAMPPRSTWWSPNPPKSKNESSAVVLELEPGAGRHVAGQNAHRDVAPLPDRTQQRQHTRKHATSAAGDESPFEPRQIAFPEPLPRAGPILDPVLREDLPSPGRLPDRCVLQRKYLPGCARCRTRRETSRQRPPGRLPGCGAESNRCRTEPRTWSIDAPGRRLETRYAQAACCVQVGEVYPRQVTDFFLSIRISRDISRWPDCQVGKCPIGGRRRELGQGRVTGRHRDCLRCAIIDITCVVSSPRGSWARNVGWWSPNEMNRCLSQAPDLRTRRSIRGDVRSVLPP